MTDHPMHGDTPMTETTVHIGNEHDIPASWGAIRRARRSTTVAIREPNGVEHFAISGGTLTARPDRDWVVVQQSGEEYPIARKIFAATYEECEPGRYRKRTANRLVQVPPGVRAVLATREGVIEVAHPDYVVIGASGEIYGNEASWVAENLVFEEDS